MADLCAFPGCDNPRSPKASRGLCNSHYWQLHKGRELTPLSYRRNRCIPWLEAHAAHQGDACLIWPFQRLRDGRAAVRFHGKQTVAARAMCELAHGPAPTPEHEAAHSCGKGTDGCVNPKHLRWATHTENEADKILHGTRLWGSALPWAKLTDADVVEIRRIGRSMPQAEVASLFGVTQSTISRVVRNAGWRHV